MPRVAPAILRTHVHDQRLGPLSLHLQGGDQRVFGINHKVIHLSLHLQSHCELHADVALAGSRLGIDWPSLLLLSVVGRPTAIGSLAGKDISIA